MLVFKCAFIVFFSTFVLSISSQVAKAYSLGIGVVILNIISGALAGKILYDRHQHIHILGSLTPNPNVTLYVNKIASISASFLYLGFLSYLVVGLFKNDETTLKAITIFLCGFGTFYMWLQSLLTTYISSLFYEKRLTVLRQCLANLSFLFVVLMAIFGALSVFLPEGDSSILYICNIVSTLSSYTSTTIFCIFMLSFEKEYKYFAEGIRSDMLIDDTCSVDDASVDESLLGTSQYRSMIKRISPRTVS